MITDELVRERLSYDHETGLIKWKKRDESKFWFNRQWNGKFAGKPAGTINKNGYVVIVMMLKGKNYSVYGHHVAWILYNGKMPEGDIDHINGNTGDNSIKNLREVSHSENMRNMRLSKANKSGVCGVKQYGNKYKAYISYNKKRYQLGTYSTLEEAAKARMKAQENFGFHKNHGKVRKDGRV